MNDLIYIGTPEDCLFLSDALDIAMDMPNPGYSAQTGIYVSTGQDAIDKKALWRSMTREQQDANIGSTIWAGWGLRATDFRKEYPPGVRWGVWIPGTLQAILANAANHGWVLSLAQQSALLAAQAVALPDVPADWVLSPEEIEPE